MDWQWSKRTPCLFRGFGDGQLVKVTWEKEGVISADLKLDRTRLPEAGDGDAPAGDDEVDGDNGAADGGAAPGLGAPSSDT